METNKINRNQIYFKRNIYIYIKNLTITILADIFDNIFG